MKSIIIVGSGPVGGFMAVLCTHLGLSVTVYEKHEGFTRNINLKIENDFFKTVGQVLSSRKVETDFFTELDNYLQRRKYRILIKELEERFTTEAKSQGAKYILREIGSFQELYEEHKDSDPIILDCTGRNSKLRINEFGSDEDNIISNPLQHAVYVNFKAKINSNITSLYQVREYIKNMKFSQVALSKNEDDTGEFSNVTLPVFISDETAHIFDEEYPIISREPLNPFYSSNPIPDSIFSPISSLLGNFIVDGCTVDLKSVTVKKIEISCGYAKKRSKDNYVCLGDSAIYLAFFRSLNLGLKHALEFFQELSLLIQPNAVTVNEAEIMKDFKSHYPHLSPMKVYPTLARNVFLVVTKVIWYGCYRYCLTHHTAKRLTPLTGVYENQISNILQELNEKFTWSNSLANFEVTRDKDVQSEIKSKDTNNSLYDYVSWFLDINRKSFIKINELTQASKGKYALSAEDFKFFLQCFKIRKDALATGSIGVIRSLLIQSQDKEFLLLKEICAKDDLPSDRKLKLINDAASKVKAANVQSYFILALIKYETTQIHMPSEPSSESDILHIQPSEPSSESDILHIQPSEPSSESDILHIQQSEPSSKSDILHIQSSEPSSESDILHIQSSEPRSESDILHIQPSEPSSDLMATNLIQSESALISDIANIEQSKSNSDVNVTNSESLLILDVVNIHSYECVTKLM